jgi:hypothetical protein
MKDAIAKYLYREHIIVLRYDEDAISPRRYSHLGKMTCYHPKYDMPNEHGIKICHTAIFAWISIILGEEPLIVMPVYYCEHSGITMTTDPGKLPHADECGIITATEDGLKEYFRKNIIGDKEIELARTYLSAEVENYATYLSGLITVVEVYDINGVLVGAVSDNYSQEEALWNAEDAVDEILWEPEDR